MMNRFKNAIQTYRGDIYIWLLFISTVALRAIGVDLVGIFFVTWLSVTLTVRHDIRLSAAVGLGLLALCPLLLISDRGLLAEEVANAAYIFLVIAVLVQLEELVLKSRDWLGFKIRLSDLFRRPVLSETLAADLGLLVLSLLMAGGITSITSAEQAMPGGVGATTSGISLVILTSVLVLFTFSSHLLRQSTDWFHNLEESLAIAIAVAVLLIYCRFALGVPQIPALHFVIFLFLSVGSLLLRRQMGSRIRLERYLWQTALALSFVAALAFGLTQYQQGLPNRIITAQWSEYDFIENLSHAVVSSQGSISVQTWELDSRSRTVIRMDPTSEGSVWAKYEITLLREATLVFGIAMLREGWEAAGDGVTFKVRVQDGIRTDEIFVRHLNPKENPDNGRWLDFELDLSEYGSKQVGIFFVTEPGPLGDNQYDQAGWAEPRLISGAKVPTETPPLAATSTCTSTPTQLVSPTPSTSATATPIRGRVSPTATSEPVSEQRIHVVQPGENLWMIAQRYGVTVEAIMYVNDMDDPRVIEVGQELVIPAPDEFFPTFTPTSAMTVTATLSPTTTSTPVSTLTPSVIASFTSTVTSTPTGGIIHVVQPGETLWMIAEQYGVGAEAIAYLNGLDDPRTIRTGQELIIPAPDEVLPAFTPVPTPTTSE
jgi:LysM repeat protein